MDQAEEQTEAMEAAEEHNERVVENLNHITVALKSMPKIAKGVPYCDFLLSDPNFTKEFGDEPDRWITELTSKIQAFQINMYGDESVVMEGGDVAGVGQVAAYSMLQAYQNALNNRTPAQKLTGFIIRMGLYVIIGVAIYRAITRSFKRTYTKLASIRINELSTSVLTSLNTKALPFQIHNGATGFLKQNAKTVIAAIDNPLSISVANLSKLADDAESWFMKVKHNQHGVIVGTTKRVNLLNNGWDLPKYKQAVGDVIHVLDNTYMVLIKKKTYVIGKKIDDLGKRDEAKVQIRLAKRFARSYMKCLHRIALGVASSV